MDCPLSDRWFEDACRREELLRLHQLRKQNSDVDDTFFPYGLIFAGPPPWAVHSTVYKQYAVGSDVERTVTYASAALGFIDRTTRKLQTDAWLFSVEKDLKQVSLNHKAFVAYEYDHRMAEQRIGRILMVAKLEQSKVDADSIPWRYTCPDGTKLSGQLRCLPHGYEQHIDLLLKYNFLIVQNYPDGSYSDISAPGVKNYIHAVANAPIGSPIIQIANPPKFFYSLPEIQYESLFQKRAVTLAPEKILKGNLSAQQTEKRLCSGCPPDIMHAYQPRDFARVPISQGCEGCTQITTEAIPDDAIPPPLPGDSINSPHITMAEFPLTPIQMATPQAPEDSTEITQEEFTHCAIKLPSSQPIGGSSKFKEKPPHFAIQVSSPAGFGRDLDFMKN